jgi:tRNA pseudouridine55 synthase
VKTPRRALSGVLLLNKPAGISSTSAVGWAKRLFNAAKAGHTGTLDPFATGLLPICFGEAAKFARFHLDADKRYRATLKLGERSSTGDTEGGIVETRAIACSADDIRSVLAANVGPAKQTPPMHSAIKIDGVPLYKLARQGIETERPARDIEIFALQCVDWAPPLLVVDAHVSKGTYMRVLAEDIGEALGCGAHLVALERTGSGSLGTHQAVTFETLENIGPEERDALLLPPVTLAQSLPEIVLGERDTNAFSNGRVISGLVHGGGQGLVRVYGPSGIFLGVANASETDAGTTLVAERLMNAQLAQSN